MLPPDTKSYVLLWYKRKNVHKKNNEKGLQKETLYEPPIYVKNFFKGDIDSDNRNRKSSVITSNLEGGMVVLFQEYGNLFRDCDALEGMLRGHKKKVYFMIRYKHLFET